jgi:hypothetical protein
VGLSQDKALFTIVVAGTTHTVVSSAQEGGALQQWQQQQQQEEEEEEEVTAARGRQHSSRCQQGRQVQERNRRVKPPHNTPWWAPGVAPLPIRGGAGSAQQQEVAAEAGVEGVGR